MGVVVGVAVGKLFTVGLGVGFTPIVGAEVGAAVGFCAVGFVGWPVGSSLVVGVGVGDGVGEGDGLGISVGVGEGVTVGVGVGVGFGTPKDTTIF